MAQNIPGVILEKHGVMMDDNIHAIGYPLNINIHTPVITHGKISGIAENGLLIITGSFNKGNSGGTWCII